MVITFNGKFLPFIEQKAEVRDRFASLPARACTLQAIRPNFTPNLSRIIPWARAHVHRKTHSALRHGNIHFKG